MLQPNPPQFDWSRLAARGLSLFVLLTFPQRLLGDSASGGIEEHPLAASSAPRGVTMFATLPASETGLVTENNYADPKMKGELFQEFETSSIGTGVAIGDYDGDGRPDIFVVSKTESCRLFRNLGGWRFDDVTERAGVGDKGGAALVWKQGATFVDVNNDGRLDLYVCRARAPNLLYINQGDGTFREEAKARGLAVVDSSVMAAFCDYDRDGWLDVYVSVNMLDVARHPLGQRGYLFRNNGNGTFANVTERAGIRGESQSHSASWWDFDNDGWPDLYVANDYGVADPLYRNNRDGTFADRSGAHLPHTAFSSMGSDVADVDNDGRLDLFVADMAATTHERDQRSIADSRGHAEDPGEGSTAAPKYHRNALLLNTGTPYAREAAFLANLAATDWTWSPRFEDLDNDGHVDLFVTDGYPRDPGTDVIKRLMAAESPGDRVRIMYETPPQAENTLALRNLGGLRFESVGPAWGLDRKGVAFGTAFGDLDGDGDLDLVYANYRDALSVLRNDSDAGYRAVFELRGTKSNRFGIGATVRVESRLGVQVRQLALARGYLSSSEPIAHFGLGPDGVMSRVIVTWPSGIEQTFANLPANRRFTITEPASGRPAPPAPVRETQFVEVAEALGLSVLRREEPVDERTEQKLLPFRLNRRGPALVAAPLVGGSREDFVLGGTSLDSRRVLFAKAEGGFAPMTPDLPLPGAPINDGPMLAFDANGDGLLDLFVAKGGNVFPAGAPEYQPELWLGDGRGHFASAPAEALPELAINAGALAAVDFDRDGRVDVFVGGRVLTGEYPQTPTSALLANRGGRFVDVTDEIAPGLREVGLVTAALWSDVDGDGWIDLLVANDWGNVRYFHNQTGAGFEDRSVAAGFASAGAGWWTSLAAADFNGDGRFDYAAGNIGLNTEYRADPKHPALLFVGDFKGDGSSQLIEGYYEGDKLYPRCCRAVLGAALPFVLKKYPRNDYYARATLPEILGADRLAQAQRFAAAELRSGVFLSQADGSYRFEPLPHIAQIAPAQGMAAGDFDGDGRADLYLVQNCYGPVPQVGRFDGGLSQLLRGDGAGHFTAVEPAESGLRVRGDAKALVVTDLDTDGWPDFVTTRNRETMLAFRSRGQPGRRSFRVTLRGPQANPSALGARITCEMSDGSKLLAEFNAGGGYYSQSSAAAFFGYAEGVAPVRLVVRWPDGVESHHRVPTSPVSLTLAPDQR